MTPTPYQATTRPWKLDDDSRAILGLFDGEYVQIAAMSRTSWSNDHGGSGKNARLSAQREANAVLIVRCVNSHDAMLEALEAARDYINGWEGCVPPIDERHKQFREWAEVNNEINAALALAQGQE